MAGAAQAQDLDRHMGDVRHRVPHLAFQDEPGQTGVEMVRMGLGHVGAFAAMQRGGDALAIGENPHRDDRCRREQRPALDAQEAAGVDLGGFQIDDPGWRRRHGGHAARRAVEDQGLVSRVADSQGRVEHIPVPGPRMHRQIGDLRAIALWQRQIDLKSGPEHGAAIRQCDRDGLIALAELDQNKLDTRTILDMK